MGEPGITLDKGTGKWMGKGRLSTASFLGLSGAFAVKLRGCNMKEVPWSFEYGRKLLMLNGNLTVKIKPIDVRNIFQNRPMFKIGFQVSRKKQVVISLDFS